MPLNTISNLMDSSIPRRLTFEHPRWMQEFSSKLQTVKFFMLICLGKMNDVYWELFCGKKNKITNMAGN
jgi:hypothetical protein